MKIRRTQAVAVSLAAGVLMLAAACSSGGTGTTASSSTGKASKKPLTLMFGSSGPAETKAVNEAAAAFTKQSGIKVNVVVASNLPQQLAQGFAGGQPPDVFYLDPISFQSYAAKGVLDPYAQALPNKNDFIPAEKAAFTYKGQFVCDPKDGGPLSLYINTTEWKQAGLTSKDIPTNWSQLQSDAKKLTGHGHPGLVIDASHSELDEFFYQNGGSIFNPAGTKVTLDSAANVQALSYVKSMLSAGTLKFPSQLNAGWSGEAFGEGKAAMIIVGNWLQGAMQADYPKVKYQGYPIPTGPTGTKATLSFTNCWGVPKSSQNLAGAVDFVKFLTSPAQEMRFAKEFGPLPSLSTLTSAYDKQFPQQAFMLAEMNYAHPDIALGSSTQALAAFDSALGQLGSNSPASILSKAQANLQAVVTQNHQQG